MILRYAKAAVEAWLDFEEAMTRTRVILGDEEAARVLEQAVVRAIHSDQSLPGCVRAICESRLRSGSE